MSFSQYAGTAILPTLARIVLGVAFVSVGYNKLFKTATFDHVQATVLSNTYGITVSPVDADRTPQIETVAFQPGQVDQVETGDLMASPRPDEETPTAETETPPPAPESVDPAPLEDVAEDVVEQVEEPPAEVLAEGEYAAKGLYKITLMMHNANMPYPFYGAWLAAITEFVGGLLLLLGFFSRVWGLGLTIAMGVAFYLVTMGYNNVFESLPWVFAQDIPAFNTMYSQLGLGLLALGILLTGPGPISVDRLLFGGKGGENGSSEDVE